MQYTCPALRTAAFGCALVAGLSLSLSALAQQTSATATPAPPSSSPSPDTASQNRDDSKWEAGLGTGIARSPYRGYGYKTSVLPLLMLDSKYFHIAGTSADLKLGSLQPFDFTLRARYSNDGYKSGDAAILNGMAERKDAIWLGGTVSWQPSWARLSLEWLKDASGNSGGQSFKLNASRGFQLGRVSLTPHLGVAWYDQKYVNYYYGVRADEANASRSAYTGKATVSSSVGLRTGYRLTPAQSVFFDASATRFGSAITDSPLVDHATVPSVRLGYLYQF